MGLQPVETEATKRALSGKTGFDVILDNRNVPVYSAYAPIQIKGLNWAILSELDEDEGSRLHWRCAAHSPQCLLV